MTAVHHYYSLYSGLASLLTLIAAFAGLTAMSDENSRSELGRRDRLRARRRAHPQAVTLWWACSAGAFVLLLTALVTWLA